jgi:hypothetical protein
MNFRLYYRRLGGHIHVRFFSGQHKRVTHGKNGDLTFRAEEWESFLRCFGDHGPDTTEIFPEDGGAPADA